MWSNGARVVHRSPLVISTSIHERRAIEARVRRLAEAVIRAHEELDRHELGLGDAGADGSLLRRELGERVEDFASMLALLPRAHPLRIVGDLACTAHARWSEQRAGTEPARARGVSLVLALALVHRAIHEGDGWVVTV
jgi:hypothetical protein